MSANDKPSIFAQQVYQVVSRIPRGRVSTYGDIARALGTRSAQAVGQALRCNPYAPEVPCHRVVARDGKIGGFFGEKEGDRIAEKIALLRAEGVVIESGNIDMTLFRHTW